MRYQCQPEARRTPSLESDAGSARAIRVAQIIDAFTGTDTAQAIDRSHRPLSDSMRKGRPMPKFDSQNGHSQSSVLALLGEEGRRAIVAHRGDPTLGHWRDDVAVPELRSDLRAFAQAIALLGEESEERKSFLEKIGLPADAIAPRLAKQFSRDILHNVDREQAQTELDYSWRKLPFSSRDELPPNAGLNTRRLSEVHSRPVEWLWEQRIPLGKLTLINGDPEIGKSWTVLDAIARITTGRAFPDSPNPFGKRRDALWVSAEDDDDDTVKPRLEILKADPTRVHSVMFVRSESRDQTLNLSKHLGELDAWLQAHPLVVMVVIDPIAAYLGKIDSHRNSDVRAVLSPLTKLAHKHQVALIGINHLSKGDGENAIYRGMGSIAFVAAARSSWMVSRDPEDADRRLFTRIKSNLSNKDVCGLAFRFLPDSQGISWEEGKIETTANDTLRQPDRSKAPARAEAEAWLIEVLKDGPVLASDVWTKAKADRLCEKTVKSAKKALGVGTTKTGGPGDPWSWSLPEIGK